MGPVVGEIIVNQILRIMGCIIFCPGVLNGEKISYLQNSAVAILVVQSSHGLLLLLKRGKLDDSVPAGVRELGEDGVEVEALGKASELVVVVEARDVLDDNLQSVELLVLLALLAVEVLHRPSVHRASLAVITVVPWPVLELPPVLHAPPVAELPPRVDHNLAPLYKVLVVQRVCRRFLRVVLQKSYVSFQRKLVESSVFPEMILKICLA